MLDTLDMIEQINRPDGATASAPIGSNQTSPEPLALKTPSLLLRCFLLVLAAACLALPAQSARAQRAELEKVIQRKVLPNGLEVIVVENHGVPLATAEITVRNGSFTQAPGYAGL